MTPAPGDHARTAGPSAPLVGIGFRLQLADWIERNRHRIDVVEITIDHYLLGNDYGRARIREIAQAMPVTAHGIGLSIGTDVPLDEFYVGRVAEAFDVLGAPGYSEHLAFTGVPGRDLANLLPLPRTGAVADAVAAKVRRVRDIVGVPVDLENVSAVFDFPGAEMDEAAFLTRVCRDGGAGILLDVENLHANAINLGTDTDGFLAALPENAVAGIHTAGGHAVAADYLEAPVWADTHDHAVPPETLDLLDRALARQSPETIVLERDDRLDDIGQIAGDIDCLRAQLARRAETADAAPA